jgi:hypothetical protein
MRSQGATGQNYCVTILIGVVRVCEHAAGRAGPTEHFLQPPRLLFHADPAELENLSHELARRLSRRRAVRIFLLDCLNMLDDCSQYDQDAARTPCGGATSASSADSALLRAWPQWVPGAVVGGEEGGALPVMSMVKSRAPTFTNFWASSNIVRASSASMSIRRPSHSW